MIARTPGHGLPYEPSHLGQGAAILHPLSPHLVERRNGKLGRINPVRRLERL